MKLIFEYIKPILALLIVCMTYVIFIIILIKYRTDSNAVSQVLIAVASGFGVATGYYFGYSQGAAKKDDQIAVLSATPVATTTTGDINVESKPITDGTSK